MGDEEELLVSPLKDEVELNLFKKENLNNPSGLRIKAKHGRNEAFHFIGNTPVSISGNLLCLPDGRIYNLSSGLRELLTSSHPKGEKINNDDAQAYRDILMNTHAHKKNVDPMAAMMPYSNTNYETYVRPYLLKRKQKKNETTGSGMFQKRKTLTNAPVEYMYYNHPEELLDRLVLVWGEIRSGNTNPNVKNEVVNILQEFKEGSDK